MLFVLKGWNYHVHRGFPRKSESRNLSRDNMSREIGRMNTLNVLIIPNLQCTAEVYTEVQNSMV